MAGSALLSLFVAAVFACKNVLSVSQHPKLLLVSYDAFRFDYFNRNLTPFMNELRREGSHAEYMRNIFVTKTFPNHFTMTTGFYAETHGVVGNEAFDPITETVINNSYALFHYNEDIVPIWIVNEQASADRHSGVVMWPGSNFKYRGVYPTFVQPFNQSMPWEARVDKLISWFTDPITPINLGLLYIEEPDSHGHSLGINSPSFNKILQKLDGLTKYIYDKLNEHGLRDVNVVHLSDHGMQTVTKEGIINLNNFLNQSDYDIVESSPSLHVFPKPGKFDIIYRGLEDAKKKIGHFNFYKKEDIPEKFHFKNNPRVGPIFVIADIGYAFQDFYQNIAEYERKYNFTANNKTEFGMHGYDNGEAVMHPMFFSYGPIFKNNYELEPFNNVDLFPLFCEILNLSCSPVNGTLKNVQSCLKTPFDVPAFDVALAVVGALLLLGIGITLTVFIIKRRRNRANSYYRILSTESDREYPDNENPDFTTA